MISCELIYKLTQLNLKDIYTQIESHTHESEFVYKLIIIFEFSCLIDEPKLSLSLTHLLNKRKITIFFMKQAWIVHKQFNSFTLGPIIHLVSTLKQLMKIVQGSRH